jgi:activator of HSP90 ATPase
MTETINALVLNELVKDLNEMLDDLRTVPKSDAGKVIAWSHVQGTLLTISSEAMALVADTAKVIGSTTSAATSATDKVIVGLLGSMPDKDKN